MPRWGEVKRSVSVRQALVYGSGGIAALMVVVCGYLWFVLLSPYGYSMPAGLAPIDASRTHRVFAYGTLRCAPVRWLVMGRAAMPRPAVLPGSRAEGLNVVGDMSARTEGVVFEVTAAELLALDRYERLGVRYERVELPLGDGEAAWVYRRLPGATTRQTSK